MDLEQTPEFGVYDEEEDNVSRTTPKPTSWPWSKFTTEKNEEYAVGENDEWDDDTEALPYKVLEKRFVSSVAKTEIFQKRVLKIAISEQGLFSNENSNYFAFCRSM